MSQTAKMCREQAAKVREMVRGFRSRVQREQLEEVAAAWEVLALSKAKTEQPNDDDGYC